MNPLLERLLWTLNGLIALFFFALDHSAAILTAVSAAFFVSSAPAEQKAWTTGAGLLAVAAALLAPAPVPLFLLVMSCAGWAGTFLEQYNKISQRWNVARGMALYALAGLGYSAYRNLGLGETAASDPMMTQGANYLNALVGIAMYVIPIGFLAWLAQSIWAHPPAPAAPEQFISNVRTRGRG
jgi:hypothetical protein